MINFLATPYLPSRNEGHRPRRMLNLSFEKKKGGGGSEVNRIRWEAWNQKKRQRSLERLKPYREERPYCDAGVRSRGCSGAAKATEAAERERVQQNVKLFNNHYTMIHSFSVHDLYTCLHLVLLISTPLLTAALRSALRKWLMSWRYFWRLVFTHSSINSSLSLFLPFFFFPFFFLFSSFWVARDCYMEKL